MAKTIITAQGMDKLLEEIKYLTEVERPIVISEVTSGLEEGDLKENARYHAARERQTQIDAKLRHLANLAETAEVINTKNIPRDGIVRFGCTVRLLNCENSKEMTVSVLSEYEADFEEGKISNTSPLAVSILGREVGDFASFSVPNGSVREYEILEISYPEDSK